MSDLFEETLGERLRRARTLCKGLSSRELGRLAGLSEAYPALIERGDREHIGADAAAALARILGVSIDYLVSGTGDAPTEAAVATAVAMARRAVPTEEAPAEPTKGAA